MSEQPNLDRFAKIFQEVEEEQRTKAGKMLDDGDKRHMNAGRPPLPPGEAERRALQRREDALNKSPEIQTVKNVHVALMHYMIANPTHSYKEIAAHFGRTTGWVSIVTNSTCFKEQLKALQEEVFLATVVPLREKVVAAGHLAIEKAAEAIDNMSPVSDKSMIIDTTERLLTLLDYGNAKNAPAAVQINNTIMAEKTALEEARSAMQYIQRKQNGGDIIEGQADEVPTTPALQDSRDS